MKSTEVREPSRAVCGPQGSQLQPLGLVDRCRACPGGCAPDQSSNDDCAASIAPRQTRQLFAVAGLQRTDTPRRLAGRRNQGRSSACILFSRYDLTEPPSALATGEIRKRNLCNARRLLLQLRPEVGLRW